MSTKKMTPKNAPLVLARLAVFVAEHPEDAKGVCDDLNAWMDDQGDMFGTEGQLDPRGDRRD